MKIIPIHYKLSKPVRSYREIRDEAEALSRFIVRGRLTGLYNKAFALSHCQVSETPYAFFVVSPDVIVEKMFEHNVIINPKILVARTYKPSDSMLFTGKSADGSDGRQVNGLWNGAEYMEPCLSFPFRKPKRVVRYDEIEVEYMTPWIFGLRKRRRTLKGIASQIFQHEYDHVMAKNIYFESDAPVKWWEMIGKAKSKGGTSLDDAGALGLERSSEHPREVTI